MPMVLHVEVNYLFGNPQKYNWIADLIANGLSQLGVTAYTHFNPNQLNSDLLSNATNDGQLQDLLYDAKKNSVIKKTAQQQGYSYLLLTIAAYHIDHSLGKMYDATIATDTRNGCAVFESEVIKIANQYGVPLKTIMGRTILHEIGHCLNLVHERDLSLMSQTDDLIESPLSPRWFRNIRFSFNQGNINYLRSNPDLARPGGRLNEYSSSDRYDVKRISDKIEIRLINFNFTNDLTFLKGDIIAINVEISNNTEKKIKLPLPLGQFSRNLCIELYSPDGESLELDLKKGCGYSSQYLSIESGSKKYVSLNLHCNIKGYIFKNPGIYKIRCTIKKFKTKNTWYTSELVELNIIEPHVNSFDLFSQVYTKNLQQFLIGGSCNKTRLIRETNFHLKNETVLNSNLLLPICWIMISIWKNEISLSTQEKNIKKAKLRLKNLYEFLLLNENSTVKRGKIAKDYIYLTENIKHKPIKHLKIDPKDIENYEDFKLKQIGRANHIENKKNYEEKLFIN